MRNLASILSLSLSQQVKCGSHKDVIYYIQVEQRSCLEDTIHDLRFSFLSYPNYKKVVL